MSTLKSFTVCSGLVLVSWACSSNAPKVSVNQSHQPDATVVNIFDASGDAATPDADASSVLQSVDDAAVSPPPPTPCNGNEAFCKKHYDELCYAATHNSATDTSGLWQFPTQSQSIHSQLDNGIRAIMLSVQVQGSADLVCYDNCSAGNTRLTTVLKSVKDFLSRNAREVVTLLLDSQAPASSIQADFVTAGLDTDVFTPTAGSPWPTLGEMIDANRRLVVFASLPDSGADWLLPRSSSVWETGSDWTTIPSMNCDPVVGDVSMPFSIVHHYIDDAVTTDTADAAGVISVAQVNSVNIVAQRLNRCIDDHQKTPNFIVVNHFELGDPIGGTQVINGVRTLTP